VLVAFLRKVLCKVLKGGHQFFSDLISAIKKLNNRFQQSIPLSLDFIRAKSYENTASTGHVEISGMDLATLKGKVLVPNVCVLCLL
jgi:hypoxanthine phosphoribosyltransferase